MPESVNWFTIYEGTAIIDFSKATIKEIDKYIAYGANGSDVYKGCIISNNINNLGLSYSTNETIVRRLVGRDIAKFCTGFTSILCAAEAPHCANNG